MDWRASARSRALSRVILPALLACALAREATAAAPRLASFPVDPTQVSVSGISSGAFMANQLHVAHSAGIMGAAMVAGGLYGCAVDHLTSDGVFALVTLATGPCMSAPGLLKPVSDYAALATELAGRGLIDPPSNLARSKIYMFTGQADSVVNSKTVEAGAALYLALGVPASQLKFRDKDLKGHGAGHSWVTRNFGNQCDTNETPYINKCGYDQAGDVLATFYGSLQLPSAMPGGRIAPFDQTEFVPGGAAAANGLSDTGYLYVPTACEPGALQSCRLIVVLHGCGQSSEVLKDEFYTKIGVNEWADANRIVVLYPQTHAISVSELPLQNFSSNLNTNPLGCWNFWGYGNDNLFLTKQGVQISAIWSMVQRITGQKN